MSIARHLRSSIPATGRVARRTLIIAILTCHFAPGISLHLRFVHVEGDRPLVIDSLRHQNPAEETYSVTRLDWLASGFALTTIAGEALAHPGLHAVVSTTGGRVTLPDVPAGKLATLSFFIGPDEATNHSDPATYPAKHPLNPNLNKLHWDWQGGYIFLAMEGHWRAPGRMLPEGYAYHFARDPNRVRVTLPLDFELRDESQVTIALDLARILDGLSFGTDGATTHSAENDPVATQIRSNLPAAFRIAEISAGGVPGPPHPPEPIDLPSLPTGYPLTFPKHVPLPALPADNPILTTRVALGERLFHETKLSRTGAISCASCHQGETLSDSRRFSPGVDGDHGTRHAMPLFNLAWKSSFFWDGRAPSLRAQVLMPIEDHREMDESLERVVAKLKADPDFPPLFAAAFGSGTITPETIGLALENFLLTRISLDSKFDRAFKGTAALSPDEQRGFELFFTESEPRLGKRGADCFHCHGGALLTDHGFHNNGIAPTGDLGLGAFTGRPGDRFKFATPSLRNVALTAPYMHDGRFATLEDVIDHYNSPIALAETLDPNLAKHPQGLGLTDDDKKALIAFLKTLSDPRFEAAE